MKKKSGCLFQISSRRFGTFSKARFQYFKFDAPFKCCFFFTSVLPAPDDLDTFLCNAASGPAPPGFEDW